MRTYPYVFHIALDGNGINGFEGAAGVCLFLYDPADGSFAFKITYYDGAAAGHAVNVSPDRRVGFLGNAGQHLLFYDAQTLDEVDRISTLRFEVNDTSIRGSTHLVWLDDREFIAAIGDWIYRFDLDRLAKPERVVPHGLKLPHSMKRSASGRYVCMGSMDHPDRGEAKEVGILDLQTGSVARVELPATCWHLVAHPHLDLFYAVSFRVLPQDYRDYHQWAMAFLKEYAFEIDAASGEVLRHWATSRETPSHINSDVAISDRELIWCNGASQTVVLLDLESFASYRIIDEKPAFGDLVTKGRTMATQFYDVLARGSWYTSNQHMLAALRVSRFTLMDAVYATALSADQRLLFTANRGMNHISVYDYPSTKLRHRVEMPDIQEYVPGLSRLADPRLGFHHSLLLSPTPGPVVSPAVSPGRGRSSPPC